MRQVLVRKIPVTAIHVDELVTILKKLGKLNEVASGSARCYFCGKPITLDDISGIISIDGKVRLVCSNPVCLAKAAKISWQNVSRS
ncbi:MAG: hypothetical protein DRN04_14855 [Thermoprotei archaeon]|nr:MAG: hypothetical protein DRN04_14855 [Thermoprotei archaeon]